jgi:transcriptional regulator with XRE-family HTH domain
MLANTNTEKSIQFSITIKRKKNFYINQAAILRACRVVSGLSQKDAAKRIKVSPATLCGWEQKGCRDLGHCSNLADLYGQDLTLLVPSTYES